MKEIRKIVDHYLHRSPSEKLALATVVSVEGSSYRRMGARMLVAENGVWVGGISGGCLEGDALKRARMAILKDKPTTIVYDTTTDDDHQIGVGLGCNGVIEVLFTPINFENEHNPLAVLAKVVNGERSLKKLVCVTKSIKSELIGEIIDFNSKDDLSQLNSIVDSNELAEQIEQLERSKNLIYANGTHIFVELIPPTIQVLIMGNQYDLYPLSRQIKELGWDAMVIANPSKIKKNDDFELISPENINELVIDEFTAVVLMSHSLETDKNNLKTILSWNLNYIGMLGPKVRSERIFEELKEEGVEINEGQMANIFAPVGLDIGATNPEEIALSIASEMKAVFSNRNAQNLRERKVPIHERNQPKKFT